MRLNKWHSINKDESKKFIGSVHWTFAKTMPDIPHEYIITDQYPEKSEEITAFVSEIEKTGYAKSFYGKEYKYLEIGGYKYWVIENIINRAKHECKGNHQECYNILSHNIINGKELFKEYWQNRYINKKPNP